MIEILRGRSLSSRLAVGHEVGDSTVRGSLGPSSLFSVSVFGGNCAAWAQICFLVPLTHRGRSEHRQLAMRLFDFVGVLVRPGKSAERGSLLSESQPRFYRVGRLGMGAPRSDSDPFFGLSQFLGCRHSGATWGAELHLGPWTRFLVAPIQWSRLPPLLGAAPREFVSHLYLAAPHSRPNAGFAL